MLLSFEVKPSRQVFSHKNSVFYSLSLKKLQDTIKKKSKNHLYLKCKHKTVIK